MGEVASDPYATLGVTSDVSDVELRRVYRDLVKRHHPDRNGGSPEATVRFAEVQNAYAAITRLRRSASAQPQAATDPGVDQRLADIEHELARQRAAALRAARERAERESSAAPPRHTREELGYYTTEDSFTNIIDDAAGQLADRLHGGSAKRQFTQRLADLFGRDSQ